jgi:uncharacterized protein YjbI with pentapeptide repeats
MADLILENTNFENADFSYSKLKNLDFTKSALKNSKFIGAYIKQCVLDGMDFSTLEIHGDSISTTDFVFCSMKYSNFSKINMFNIDFTSKDIKEKGEFVVYPGSDLSHSLFSDLDLRTTMFSTWSKVDHKTFFYKKFEIPLDMEPLELVRNVVSAKLEYTKFDNVNLSGNDLSVISLRHSEIIDSNLTNMSFKNSDLSFSSIINSDLSGANLEGANLEGVNLEGVNLEGANLKCLNHPICLDR